MINLVTTSDESHASHRYRTLVISQQLLLHGIPCRITPTFALDATVCVYSKHWSYADYVDALGAKSMGKRIVFDCCDLHVDTKHAEHYARMIKLADQLTCNSEEMARQLMTHYGRRADVIVDPIIMQPIDREPDLDKWCWTGHHNNYPSLKEWFPLLEGRHLEVCISHGFQVDRLDTRVISWNPISGERILDNNGVCLVPYDANPRRQIKSANRVIEALNKSMVVVSNGIDATKDLAPFIEPLPHCVGPDSIRKMQQGREYVRKHYSQAAIGKQWRKVLAP